MAENANCNYIMCELDLNNKEEANKWLLENHPDKGGMVDSGLFNKVVQCRRAGNFCQNEEDVNNPATAMSQFNTFARPKPKPPSKTAQPTQRRRHTQNLHRRTQKQKFPTNISERGNATPTSSSNASSSNASSSSATFARRRSNSLSASPRSNSSSRQARQRGNPTVWLKKRKKIYNCMRQTENWSKMLPQHKFDSKKFNPAMVAEAMHNASPKLEQLFQIIEQVDANDLATHGQYFKHFIFSDVKEEGYGAKILASAFVAKGYKNLISTRAVPGQKALKMTLLQAGDEGENNSFGLLSSSAIFGTEFSQKFKKEVLQTYNRRPDNIQGAEMRFIILDSGFKEGIDLFDVKYVHIFEPSMTIADLKQTIGRATRTCGQKGLNFEPNVGWPLYVYNYYIAVPEEFKDMYQASEPKFLETPEEDKYIFKNADKLKDAAILYSEFDRTLTKLAEQLYKLAPVFSVDFGLTANIHRIHDMTYLYDAQGSLEGPGSTMQGSEQLNSSGGARPSLQNINQVRCAGKCGLRSTNNVPATVNFLLKVYKKYKHDQTKLPEENVRGYLCNYMKENEDFCRQVNVEWAYRAAAVPDLVHKEAAKEVRAAAKVMALDKPLMPPIKSMAKADWMATRKSIMPPIRTTKPMTPGKSVMPPIRSAAISSKAVSSKAESSELEEPGHFNEASYLDKTKTRRKSSSPLKKSSSPKTKKTTSPLRSAASMRSSASSASSMRSSSIKSLTPKSVSSLKIANEVMQQLDLVPYIEPVKEIDYAIVEYTGHTDPKLKTKTIGPPPRKLNFTHMRDFIKTNYAADFTWDEIVIENKCVDPNAEKAPEPAQTQIGGSRIMKLNPTQDFVRTFFTPQSPYKGILLFHSVGTGKTCSAIATATSSFEKEGYTILWVTRNTLKNDVYKNMFDDVCHIILAERMQRDGLKIPDDPAKRKRLLSKSWIEPISYKTFSNLLTPGSHNVYMDKLIERNGKADILRKTLIIIDEAHKLYGGDLKASERPNMQIMEQLLQKSYDKSGKDSARLLIMTATPFTNSPMELFKLINLCKEDNAEHITTDIKEFKRGYMNSENILTEAGSKKLADKLSGYISYLNREQDPTQFAQPIMIEVPTIMSQIPDQELRDEFIKHLAQPTQDEKANKATEKKTSKAQLQQNKERIKDLKARMQETKKRVKAIFTERSARCKTIKNKAEKAACMADAQARMEDELRDSMLELMGELERLKGALGNKETKTAEKERLKALKKRVEDLKESLVQEAMLIERCKSIKL